MFTVAFVPGCGRNAAEAPGGEEENKDDSRIEPLQKEENGTQENETQENETQENGIQENRIQENGIQENGMPDEEAVQDLGSEGKEKGWTELQEELRPSIVQISCGGFLGSGVIWKAEGEEVIVVSTAHLLKNAEICDVVCSEGIFYEAQVKGILEDCDIGFAAIPIEALKADGVELIPAMPCSRLPEELIRGEELAVYGSMDYVAGNFIEGYLWKEEIELELPVYGKKQTLLLGKIKNPAVSEGEGKTEKSVVQAEGGKEEGSSTAQAKSVGEEGSSAAQTESGEEEEGSAGQIKEREDIKDGNLSAEPERPGLIDAGMSGSGVFDRQGCLLGILVGGDGTESFAAVPVWKFQDSGF